MQKIVYNGIEFDSEEERLFYLYCEELKSNGFIKYYTYHVDCFTLSEPVKYNYIKKLHTKNKKIEGTLMHGHEYTPDFKIYWNIKAHGIFYYDIFDDEHKLDKIPFVNNIDNEGNDAGTYVEVKPCFDMNNMQRLFAINQKWVFQQYQIYVQKIIPVGKKSCLFADTFVPQESMLTRKTKVAKKYKFETKSLNEFLGGFHA